MSSMLLRCASLGIVIDLIVSMWGQAPGTSFASSIFHGYT